MRLIWTETNLAEIAKHGLTTDAVLAVFEAEDFDAAPVSPKGRFCGEAKVDGKTFRLIFHFTGDEGIYVVTAYQISSKRRTT